MKLLFKKFQTEGGQTGPRGPGPRNLIKLCLIKSKHYNIILSNDWFEKINVSKVDFFLIFITYIANLDFLVI